jgi:hypothetical protein
MLGVLLRPSVRVRLAALVAGGLASGLAGCAYLVADSFPELAARTEAAAAGEFFALPLRAMITRDTVTPRTIVACDAVRCGHDVVVGIIEASGAEARRLVASLNDPRAVEAMVERRPPDNPQVRARLGLPKPVPAETTVQRVSVQGQRGLRIEMAGGPKGRRAVGFVVLAEAGPKPQFIIAVSTDGAMAEGYAAAALEARRPPAE